MVGRKDLSFEGTVHPQINLHSFPLVCCVIYPSTTANRIIREGRVHLLLDERLAGYAN